MSRLTRDGTAEPVSRDQSFRREQEQGNNTFPLFSRPWAGLATLPGWSTLCYKWWPYTHRYIHIYRTCPLHTNSGRGKIEAHINCCVVKPEKAAPVTGNTLRTTWPCAGGHSAVNAIGTHSRDLINSGLTRWRIENKWTRPWKSGEKVREQAPYSAWVVWRMSRLARDSTAEPVSRDQILRRERERGNINFSCSADHEQYWPPYPVNPCCKVLNRKSRYFNAGNREYDRMAGRNKTVRNGREKIPPKRPWLVLCGRFVLTNKPAPAGNASVEIYSAFGETFIYISLFMPLFPFSSLQITLMRFRVLTHETQQSAL